MQKRDFSADPLTHCVCIPLRLFFPRERRFLSGSDINNGLESLLVPLSYHFPFSFSALSNCQSNLLISSALFPVVSKNCGAFVRSTGARSGRQFRHIFRIVLVLFSLLCWRDGAIILARLWGKLLVFSFVSVIP